MRIEKKSPHEWGEEFSRRRIRLEVTKKKKGEGGYCKISRNSCCVCSLLEKEKKLCPQGYVATAARVCGSSSSTGEATKKKKKSTQQTFCYAAAGAAAAPAAGAATAAGGGGAAAAAAGAEETREQAQQRHRKRHLTRDLYCFLLLLRLGAAAASREPHRLPQ